MKIGIGTRKKTRNIDSSGRCTRLSDGQNKHKLFCVFVIKPAVEYWNFYP